MKKLLLANIIGMFGLLNFLTIAMDLHETTKDLAHNIVNHLYRNEICGICRQPGKVDTLWFSKDSRVAHSMCYYSIAPCLSFAYETLKKLQQIDKQQAGEFFLELVNLVDKEIKPLTMLDVVNSDGGPHKLTTLFSQNINKAIENVNTELMKN